MTKKDDVPPSWMSRYTMTSIRISNGFILAKGCVAKSGMTLDTTDGMYRCDEFVAYSVQATYVNEPCNVRKITEYTLTGIHGHGHFDLQQIARSGASTESVYNRACPDNDTFTFTVEQYGMLESFLIQLCGPTCVDILAEFKLRCENRENRIPNYNTTQHSSKHGRCVFVDTIGTTLRMIGSDACHIAPLLYIIPMRSISSIQHETKPHMTHINSIAVPDPRYSWCHPLCGTVRMRLTGGAPINLSCDLESAELLAERILAAICPPVPVPIPEDLLSFASPSVPTETTESIPESTVADVFSIELTIRPWICSGIFD